MLAVLAHAHVAGRDTEHLAVGAEQNLGRREAGIDLDAKAFGGAAEPAADLAERDDEVAVIAHQRRHHEIRQTQRARRAEIIEAVVGDLRLDRRVLLAPIGQELVEPDRIDHGAGEDVSADLGALLDHDDGDVGRELLEPDRRRQPGRTGADDDDVELHRFARRQLVGHSGIPLCHCAY